LLTNKTKTKWNTSRSETRDEKRYDGDAVTLEEYDGGALSKRTTKKKKKEE
jgi:hypothetical protein